MVGRAAEVAVLAAARELAARGRARFVLVSGEAGIGKTRLVRALAQRARADGWRILWGECVPAVAGELPYAPFVAALRDELGNRLAAPAPRMRAFELGLAVLQRIASGAPALLVIEDLHWADGDSEDFLRYLLSNLDAEPL